MHFCGRVTSWIDWVWIKKHGILKDHFSIFLYFILLWTLQRFNRFIKKLHFFWFLTFLPSFSIFLSTEQNAVKKMMTKMFMTNGLRVDISDYKVIAETLQRQPPTGVCHNILFVAHQLQFSDGQVFSFLFFILSRKWNGITVLCSFLTLLPFCHIAVGQMESWIPKDWRRRRWRGFCWYVIVSLIKSLSLL